MVKVIDNRCCLNWVRWVSFLICLWLLCNCQRLVYYGGRYFNSLFLYWWRHLLRNRTWGPPSFFESELSRIEHLFHFLRLFLLGAQNRCDRGSLIDLNLDWTLSGESCLILRLNFGLYRFRGKKLLRGHTRRRREQFHNVLLRGSQLGA